MKIYPVKQYLVRHSISICAIIIAACLFAILILNAATLSKMKEQISALQQVTRSVQENSKVTKQQIDTVNRHLDCVTVFFTRQNRANLSIADINNCTLSTGEVIVTPTASNSSSTTPTPPTSRANNNTNSTEASNQNLTQTPIPTPNPPLASEPQPTATANILGLPICISLQGNCLKN